MARWIAMLETYDFEIRHRKGTLHTNADSLSRLRYSRCKRSDCPSCVEQPVVNPVVSGLDGLAEGMIDANVSSPSAHVNPVMTDHSRLNSTDTSHDHSSSASETDSEPDSNLPNWLEVWSHEQLVQMQSEDPDISKIIQLKDRFDVKPSREFVENVSSGCRTLWGLWELLEVKDNLLYYKWHYEDRIRLLLVAPSEIRMTIFKELHSNRTAGHFGRDKTISAIKRRFFWSGMRKDIKRWCKECDLCARAKPGPGVGRHPLQQSAVGAPFDRLGIDIIGNCPITENGNEYIIVVTDYFTKWVEAFAVPDHTAQTVADKLVTEFICRFGTPKVIHSDQGKEFESALFHEICLKLGIQKTRTTPYRPQSDGLVERANQTLERILSMLVNENRNDWDDHLPYVLMAYRASVHQSTKCTPNLLMFGRELSCPLDIMVGAPPEIDIFTGCEIEYVEWVKLAMAKAFEKVRSNLGEAAIRQKKYYDRGLKVRIYQVGDLVWRWYPPLANVKLGLGWTGPYKIVQKLSECVYKIQNESQNKEFVVHVDHLKPYEGRELLHSWSDSIEDSHSEDLGNFDTPPDSPTFLSENSFVSEPTIETPKRTRCGRSVRPPVIFSPS